MPESGRVPIAMDEENGPVGSGHIQRQEQQEQNSQKCPPSKL
jgi:hypothetical protein